MKEAITQSTVPVMGTKAETLQFLKEQVTCSVIEQLMVVTQAQLEADEAGLCQSIAETFGGNLIVVRSSCKGEDGYLSSNAGHFESLLYIDSGDATQTAEAIRKVALSYAADILDYKAEQVLLQRQTTGVAVSGVLFTRDMKEDRPYYMITYDSSGSTESVTSGTDGQQLWIARNVNERLLPSQWKALIVAVREIQDIYADDRLDIEFAVCENHQVVIFQVRPLAASRRNMRNTPESDHAFDGRKELVKAKYGLTYNIHNHKPMMLSDMAFWNPVDMIGENPPPLSYSLYREIITHSSWNKGLQPLGYRRVVADLMYAVGNKPYIAVDYAFETLIPVKVDGGLTRKLISYYKNQLQADLSAHDKIEFEIVFSCFDFTVKERLKRLLQHGFTKTEVKQIGDALYEQTVQMIQNYEQTLEADLADVKKMHENCCALEQEWRASKKKPGSFAQLVQISDHVSSLLTDIRRYGTKQFSRQARLAFVARSLCTSLVERGFVTEQEMEAFMSSLHTVASRYEADYKACQNGQLSKEFFLETYGHLRSGTYDITCPRYDQMDVFGSEAVEHILPVEEQPFDWNVFAGKIEGAVTEAGLPFSSGELLKFCKMALEQREFFKFEFTRPLSLCLERIADLGQGLGISRERMAFLEVTDIMASGYYRTLEEWSGNWNRIIDRRIEYHRLQKQLILPEVIQRMEDLDYIPLIAARPNFITTRTAEGEVVLLEKHPDADLAGKIVVLQQADPGFDWIFTKRIAGLITRYGGAASHMAIRCAEFGIPAAIGCGSKWYESIRKATYVRMDCMNGCFELK